jgi:DNA-binding HxlR family transcriptional regulator/DNA-binding response OmpR family regulator
MTSANTQDVNVRQIKAATELFSYKWHPVILYTVHELDGAAYSELEAALDGVSSKMLSDGLSALCERNILETTERTENSGRTIYVLSDKGRALIPAMQVLDAWSQRYQTQRLSVLIVENERMVATILADYFPGSYDVRSVQTGEGAIEEHTDGTDLLIVDRKLDGISGDDVAARIKAEHERQLVLCVSGVEPDNDICELRYDDYIHKPVEEDEMKARVELLFSRTELEATERTYLSLRSKQIALTGAHGKSATKMTGFQNCTARIEELDLSAEEKQTLEPLLPSTADESPRFGD